jgi:hypothetical protein
MAIRKVNLSALRAEGVVSQKGRPAFADAELTAALKALDPKVEGDAFAYVTVPTDLPDDDQARERAKHRTRVMSAARKVGVKVTTAFHNDGTLIVGLKPADKPKRSK